MLEAFVRDLRLCIVLLSVGESWPRELRLCGLIILFISFFFLVFREGKDGVELLGFGIEELLFCNGIEMMLGSLIIVVLESEMLRMSIDSLE